MIKLTNNCLFFYFISLIIFASTGCNKAVAPLIDPDSCIKSHDKDVVMSCLNEVIKNNPKNAKSYLYLGSIYGTNNDYDNAIKEFERGLSAVPDDEMLLIITGEAYISKKNIDKAILIFSKTTKLYPRSGLAFCDLGGAYIEKAKECEKTSPYTAKGYARQAYEAYIKARPLAPQYSAKIDYTIKSLDKYLRYN